MTIKDKMIIHTKLRQNTQNEKACTINFNHGLIVLLPIDFSMTTDLIRVT